MTQEVATALYSFFNDFGIPGYVTNFVPTDAAMPYITYDLSMGDTFETTPVGVKVWYPGVLPTALFDTVEHIRERIANGLQLPCGNGYLYIYPGTPFAQPAADENPDISVMYLNINITYDLN